MDFIPFWSLLPILLAITGALVLFFVSRRFHWVDTEPEPANPQVTPEPILPSGDVRSKIRVFLSTNPWEVLLVVVLLGVIFFAWLSAPTQMTGEIPASPNLPGRPFYFLHWQRNHLFIFFNQTATASNLLTGLAALALTIFAELQATIVGLQNDIQALEKTAPDVDLFDLLGLKLTPSEKAQITQAVQDIVGLVSAVQAAQQAEVQANISATDQIIADRQRRVDALQAELDREYDAARAGLANNVDLIQRRINEEKRAAEEDKRRRKELVEDQRRLAKQQLVIGAIVQGSALITAAANAIKFAAAEGGAPAIIAALGSIAAFIAFFIGIQDRQRH